MEIFDETFQGFPQEIRAMVTLLRLIQSVIQAGKAVQIVIKVKERDDAEA